MPPVRTEGRHDERADDARLGPWENQPASPPAAAASLSRHQGDLLLGGVVEFAGPVARHLANHGGKLHLHGLVVLGNETTTALGQRSGFLGLKGLQRLSVRQAAALARHRGELQLPTLAVDDAIVECLGRHLGALLIRLPHDVRLHRLGVLVGHQGPLEIGGFRKLDEPRARVRAAQRGPAGRSGLSCLFIDDVAAITPAVAAILATHTAGSLALPCPADIDEDSAREIVKHPLLALDRLRRVSDRVADILATHAGVTLSLRGLWDASPRALARLRQTPSIELDRSA